MSLLTFDGRSNEIVEVAQRFEIDHITHPDARQIGMSFARLAQELILRVRRDDDGLVLALGKLLEAREEAIVAIAPAPRKEQARQAAAAPKPTPPRNRSKSTTASR